jgi:hypothetical protein
MDRLEVLELLYQCGTAKRTIRDARRAIQSGYDQRIKKIESLERSLDDQLAGDFLIDEISVSPEMRRILNNPV